MADDYEEDYDINDDGSEDDDLAFDEGDDVGSEVGEGEGEAEGEGDELEDEEGLKEDEYVSEIDEDEDDLTEFQKMLVSKQKQEFRTKNHYTKYEPAALIGYRAQQIAEGAEPLTEVGNLTDPLAMATKEFMEGKIPYVLERVLPSNKIGKYTYERRNPDELINVNPLI